MRVTWTPPWQCEPVQRWVFHTWRIAEPLTQRTYEVKWGSRFFGFEFERHDTRSGSVL